MNRRTQILLGAAGVAGLSLAAAGYALGPGGHDPMRMFDSDGNGALSLGEVRQGAATMFQKVDSNSDGRISEDEMRAHHRSGAGHGGGHHKGGKEGGASQGGPRAMHMDKDGDGAVTLAEVQGALDQHFTQVDSDRNGSVTREEMEAAHRTMHGRR